MPARELTETELVKLVISGDRKAQELLFQKYSRRMMAVCIRYAGNRDDAEDVLQEGFITVFKKINQFKGDGSLEGWIRSIMIRIAIRKWKKHKDFINESIDAHFDLQTDAVTIIDQLNARELLQMIASLPEGYRMVFNMYAIDGYSHAEIAGIMHIQESTSRSQLVKARQQLQKLILQNENTIVQSIYKGDEKK
ncbi:MAG: RNA polymerase sigma factor [Bacteroidota bacterium]